MKTLFITIITPVLLFALIFGLICFFAPILMLIIPAVWRIKALHKQTKLTFNRI
ncbi:MAG: hypothetical protein JNJ57_11635 [Saprospiraceae bacterium]|nr:hypothetical protein [Saprospiraceae bacterium]